MCGRRVRSFFSPFLRRLLSGRILQATYSSDKSILFVTGAEGMTRVTVSPTKDKRRLSRLNSGGGSGCSRCGLIVASCASKLPY